MIKANLTGRLWPRGMPRTGPDSCQDGLGSAACLSFRPRRQHAAAVLHARRLDHPIEFPILLSLSY